MTIERKLLGTTPVSGGIEPEAVSFGTGDRLSRTSDLTSNIDSKTVTISCFFYADAIAGANHYSTYDGTAVRFHIKTSGPYVGVYGKNSSGTVIVYSGWHHVAVNTWNHILVSFDLTDASKRFIYLNDKPAVPSSSAWPTYTNDNIKFTNNNHFVRSTTTSGADGGWHRESNLFLDYTYRDLSVTANRRLFIDADGKPSSTIPSSPILYLPMTDAATAGSNSGTGGDFTVNGVLATAERGPNQDNCSASNFATAADTLLRSDNQGWVATKTITCSFTVDTLSSNNNIYGAFAPSERVKIKITSDDTYADSSTLSATFNSAANGNDSVRFILTNDIFMRNRHSHITFSFDASDTSKRHLYVNGEAVSANWLDFNNTNLQMNNVTKQYINATNNSGDNGTNTNIGEFYMANAYYDLATDNPFWDSDLGKPNSVRKVIADTGVTPLIALPIMGNDAGNNLGSGGDFTVNSGPYTGARGGSEFWSRSADFGSSAGYLKNVSFNSAITGFTFACVFDGFDSNSTNHMVSLYDTTMNNNFFDISPKNGLLHITVYDKNWNASIFQDAITATAGNSPFLLLVSISSNKAIVYLDGVQILNASTTFDGVDTFSKAAIGTDARTTINYYRGNASFIYFAPSYTDFSQEANRNKFVDQLGYPKDLTQQIEDGDIPNPLIYMKFDDTAALGTNSGTGGNFTVNGTVTAGADVTP